MIFLIIILGLILRLILSNQSLWLDEAINVLAAKNLSFWHFVTGYPLGDFHPPLYFGILWVWSHIFGYNEIFLRMPSIILGTATIYLVYLISKKVFDKKVGILAALFLAVNPLQVYYSQEARMYALAAFCVSLSVFLFLKLLENKKYLLPFALSVNLVLYSDYVAYLILPSLIVFLILFKREKLKEVLLGMVLGLVPFLPWLIFIFPSQFQSGLQTAQNVPGWKAVVGGASFKNLGLVFVKSMIGRVSFYNKFLYGGLVLIIGAFYGFLVLRIFRKINNGVKLILIWVAVPVVLAFLISFFTPVLSYFRLLYLGSAFSLGLSYGVYQLKKRFIKPAAILVTLISLFFLGMYFINPDFQREDWRDLANFLNQQNPNKSLILFENSNELAPYLFYDSGKVKALGGLSKFPARSLSDVVNIPKISAGRYQIFLIDYLVGISDPEREVDKSLTKYGFKVIKVYNFPSVGLVYEYTK